MPGALIFTDREAGFLHELVKNKAPFIIVGLSAATLQGAPAVTQDIDLWFKSLKHPGIKKALRKVGGIYVPPTVQNSPMFAGEGLELFDICIKMDGLKSFDAEYRAAIEVPLGRVKVKVLPIERIIVSKRAAARDKDRLSLRMLKDAAAAIRGRLTENLTNT